MKNKVFIGSLSIVIAALLWSLDGTFLRPHLFSLPSPLVVFLEHSLGLIILIPFLFIHKDQFKNINKKTYLAIFWVALFGGALGTTFMTKALFLTGFKDISVVILLQKFQPIFAIGLAAIFLRERFPRIVYLYSFIAIVAGYFVTFSNPWTINNLKTATALTALYSLLAAFSWGSSTTFGKYSLKNIPFGLLTALRFLFTVLIMVVPVLYFYNTKFSSVSSLQWSTLVTIVFTSGAAAMYLYYFGLTKIPASLATMCELAWPVSAIFFDYILNHNVLAPSQFIAAAILIFAVYKITQLNQSHILKGVVIKGINRGKEFAVATANLDVKLANKLPMGLYTATVQIGQDDYKGLLYYGYNSVSKTDCLETHILNFSKDIYEKEISVTTISFIRPQIKFQNSEDLKKQITKDLEVAKKLI